MTLNVSLTPHLEDFIRQTVTSGRFQSDNDVICTALRLLEEREYELHTLAQLRESIQAGLDSGASTPLDMEAIKQLGRSQLSQS